MIIENSKNIVNAHIDAEGNVIIGDGNNITVINLKEAAQYKYLETQLEKKNEKFIKIKQKIEQYPEDKYFEDELLNISKEIDEINSQKQTLINEVLKLVEEFSKIPINTERLRLAKQFFETGEFEKARAILDSEKMQKELDNAINQEELGQHLIQQATKKRQQLSNEYLILAHLTSIDFADSKRFETAKEYYDVSLKANRNILNLFSFAYFLQNHNQFSEALPLFIDTIEMFKGEGNVDSEIFLNDFATAYNNLGEIYRMINYFEEAEQTFINALNIYKQLVKKQTHYKVYIAHLLNNLGLVNKARYKFDLAEDNYLEALKIYRGLAKNNSEIYLPLGGTLNNLGILYVEQKEFEIAEKVYNDALEIKKKLKPLISSIEIALTLNNIGVLNLYRKKYESSKEVYFKALAINRELVAINPYTYSVDLANTLSNLGNLQREIKEYKFAEDNYQEALKIFKSLAKSNSLSYKPNVAALLTNLAVLYSEKKEIEMAEKLYIEALNIRRDLIIINPQFFLPALAMSAGNMSLFYQQALPNREQSLILAKEALQSALPFEKYLINAQQIISLVKQIVEKWGIDFTAFLQEAIVEK